MKQTIVFVIILSFLVSGCVPSSRRARNTPQAAAPERQEVREENNVALIGYLQDKKSSNAYEIKDKQFTKAYDTALANNKIKDKWIKTMDGPGMPIIRVRIGAEEYLHQEFCKTHSCSANNVNILYNPESKAIHILLRKDHEERWLGDVPEKIKKAYPEVLRVEQKR